VAVSGKAKGKRQKAKGKSRIGADAFGAGIFQYVLGDSCAGHREWQPFAFCLLRFAFCLS